MKRYAFSLVGAVVAVLFYLLVACLDADLFELMLELLNSVEAYELDEIFFSALIFIGFMVVDLVRDKTQVKIEHQKLEVFRATLDAVNHVVNNFLNQMQYFKFRLLRHNPDAEVIALYDEVIEDATRQLQRLSRVEQLTDKTIRESVYPEQWFR